MEKQDRDQEEEEEETLLLAPAEKPDSGSKQTNTENGGSREARGGWYRVIPSRPIALRMTQERRKEQQNTGEMSKRR